MKQPRDEAGAARRAVLPLRRSREPEEHAEGRDVTILGQAERLPVLPERGTLFVRPRKLRVTQQYLIGQFSVLLEGLQPRRGERLANAVGDLRREVESCPPWMLRRLAHEAIDLSDTICWDALERGDACGFGRCASAAFALGEFTECAGLMDE
jgi:hypothetical protein